MKTPLFIRPLIENERIQIHAGLRSKDAFVLRRSQVLLASERGERAPAIASQFGCHRQTVLNIIHGFNTQGLAVLQEGSSRPHRLRTTFPEEALEALQNLLHRSPRDFGLDTSVWTLSLAARISFQQTWIREHNQQVKQEGKGVRILPFFLPTKSPWLNPIEPKWVHAKKAIVEPDGLLSAQQLAERMCAHFGCSYEPLLSIVEEVA